MAEETNSTSAADNPATPRPTGGKEQWCAVCEISVPRGYLKCPKCKQRMPAARRKAAAGGTSVAMIGGARRPFWLLLGLGGAVAAAIYFHYGITDTYNSIIRRSPAAAVTYDGGIDAADDAGPAASAEQRDQALATLIEALETASIDATVEVNDSAPDGVIIRSAECGNPALADTINATESDLADADYSNVKCYAPSGTVLFRKSW